MSSASGITLNGSRHSDSMPCEVLGKETSVMAYVQMSFAILLFGTAIPVSQVLTSEVHILDGTAIRLTIAAIFFLPLIWRRRHEIRAITTKDVFLVMMVSTTLVAVSGLMLCSTRLAPCNVICTVTCFTPIVTALGAILFFRDRPRSAQMGWICVAAVSALVLRLTHEQTTTDQEEFAWLAVGVLLTVGAVICDASGILIAKMATRRLSALTLAALSTVMSVIIILPFALLDGSPINWTSLSPRAWLAGIWWGAAGLTAGTWLWYAGIKQTSATTAAAFLSLLPFVTVAISVLMNL